MEVVRHVVVLQYAGDYGEVHQRIADGGAADYPSQEYSLTVVEELVAPDSCVTSLCCVSTAPKDRVLKNGVRSIALGFQHKVDEVHVCEVLKDLKPTHLLLRTPLQGVLRFARDRGLPVIATLADSFELRGAIRRFRNARLAALLNADNVLVVGNHGRNACENLAHIGVRPDKIVQWDWPQPSMEAIEKPFPVDAVRNILYVGMIHVSKGVGDLVQAIAILRARGIEMKLDCVGGGEIDEFTKLALQRGVDDVVAFRGKVPNMEVQRLMRHSDLVVIPSRHTYPEGFPLTIYEALRSRTPIVASDHPMFRGLLVDGKSAKVFRAGKVRSLARAIEELAHSPLLYEELSRNAGSTYDSLQCATKWGDLVHQWIPPTRIPSESVTPPR